MAFLVRAFTILAFVCAVILASQEDHFKVNTEKRLMLTAFLKFDENEDGQVKEMELYHVLTYLDGVLGYSQEEARTLLSLADLDRDFQLSRSDLMTLVELVQTESLQH